MRLSAARSGPAPAAAAQLSAPARAAEPIAWVSLRIDAGLRSHSYSFHDRRAPSGAASLPRQDEGFRRSVPVVTRAELPRLALRFLAGDAVSFLQPACELIAVSFQLGEVIVRELAPLLLDAAFDLLPLACGAIAVRHGLDPPYGCAFARNRARGGPRRAQGGKRPVGQLGRHFHRHGVGFRIEEDARLPALELRAHLRDLLLQRILALAVIGAFAQHEGFDH